jgi:uncharacterized membrane protein YccC
VVICRESALHEVEEPREAAQLVERAEAIKYLSEKAALSQEVQDQAAEVALRARRRAGELVAEMPKNAGGRPFKTTPAIEAAVMRPPTLRDLVPLPCSGAHLT